MPHYVMIQLRAMAVRESCTQRHLVLKALPSIGIDVDTKVLVHDRRSARLKRTRTHYAKPKSTVS